MNKMLDVIPFATLIIILGIAFNNKRKMIL